MVDSETAIPWIETRLYRRTGQRLSDLQRIILQLGLRGKRYLEIADVYGCTEGHAKDVGAKLWRALSLVLGEKVTKQNLRSAVSHCLQSAKSLPNNLPQIPLDPAAHHLFRWSWEQPSVQASGGAWGREDFVGGIQ